MYNKEIDRVRTSRTNSIFEAISLLAKNFGKNKNAPLFKKGQDSHSVGMTRFELATPRPPDVCATELRYIPNLTKVKQYFISFSVESYLSLALNLK